MPRWKTSEQILIPSKDGEFFDDNWMNYNSIFQYIPPSPPWISDRNIRFEDVDLWEVISEMSGPVGVYCAWCPYEEYYIVTKQWSLWQEFEGYMANERLEKFLRENKIPYPRTNNSPTPASHKVIEKKLIITNNFKINNIMEGNAKS